MSGQPGESIQGDELDMVMRLIVSNPRKVAVADLRPHVTKVVREKTPTHTVNGIPAGAESATVTIKTSDQVAQSMSCKPGGQLCHVLMIAIPAEMIDDARRRRDSRIIRPV